MSELLPCPFCGQPAELLAYSLSAMVHCTNCNVQGKWHKGDGAVVAAVAAWNRRAPMRVTVRPEFTIDPDEEAEA